MPEAYCTRVESSSKKVARRPSNCDSSPQPGKYVRRLFHNHHSILIATLFYLGRNLLVGLQKLAPFHETTMPSVLFPERRTTHDTSLSTGDMRSGMNDATYAAYTLSSTPENMRKLDRVIRRIPFEQALAFLEQTLLPGDEEGRTALIVLSKAVGDGHFSKDVTRVLETLVGWPTTPETGLTFAMAWRYLEERVHLQAEIPDTSMRAEWEFLKG